MDIQGTWLQPFSFPLNMPTFCTLLPKDRWRATLHYKLRLHQHQAACQQRGVFTTSQLLFLLCPSKVQINENFSSCLKHVFIGLVVLIHLVCRIFYSCIGQPKDLPGFIMEPAMKNIWYFPIVSFPILSQQCLQPTFFLSLLRHPLLWSAFLIPPY